LTTVNFGGHTWIVVGTAESAGASGEGSDEGNPQGNGIQSQKGITLLLEKTDESFGKTAFGSSNSYKDSTLRSALETAANSFSLNEQSVIALRTLRASDDAVNQMQGSAVADQKFWAVSFNEFRQLTGVAAKSNWANWWLRSVCCDGRIVLADQSGDSMSGEPPPLL
jgi:hypothetical protein